jgi:hypothetical protein
MVDAAELETRLREYTEHLLKFRTSHGRPLLEAQLWHL